jgi:hypothetical protein
MAQGISNKQYSSSFFSGVGGRVTVNNQVAVFIKEWSLEIMTEVYGSPTFESPVFDGLVWDVKRFISLSEARVELTGYALNSSLVPIEISTGSMVSLRLYISVDNSIFLTVPRAVVQTISYSQDATGTLPVELKMTLEVDGPVVTPED